MSGLTAWMFDNDHDEKVLYKLVCRERCYGNTNHRYNVSAIHLYALCVGNFTNVVRCALTAWKVPKIRETL
jgi:hypothetical protein